MGGGKKVYTFVSFSSQNNSNFKCKIVQQSPFRHWSEMKE